MNTLNERIKQARLSRQLRQTQVANELGISQRMLSAIESGNSNPTLETLIKIAAFYGVTTDYLLLNEIEIPTQVERDILREIRTDKTIYNALINIINAKKTINAL